MLAARIKDVGASLRASGRDTDWPSSCTWTGRGARENRYPRHFLKADLERSGWLVVEFNAWRNQTRKPAWHPLILEVRRAAMRSATWWTPVVWLAWFWWRLRMDWMPYLVAVLLISLACVLAWWAGLGSQPDPLQNAGEAFKALGAIVATVISVLALARGFSLGSHRNAEAYLESKAEPFRRVIRLFEWMVWAVHRPVAVFVDDLDRCDGTYVIELLEGIQTSLPRRSDRLCRRRRLQMDLLELREALRRFRRRDRRARPPARLPLPRQGVQLSTSMPRLSARRQADYWRMLLDRSLGGAGAMQYKKQDLEAEASDKITGKTRQEDVQREIDRAPAGTIERESLLAAAAKQTASAATIRAVEHRLQSFAGLMEANPRAMKRLVNAYGLNQARAYLEDRKVPVEALAAGRSSNCAGLCWPSILRRTGPKSPRDFMARATFPTRSRRSSPMPMSEP